MSAETENGDEAAWAAQQDRLARRGSARAIQQAAQDAARLRNREQRNTIGLEEAQARGKANNAKQRTDSDILFDRYPE